MLFAAPPDISSVTPAYKCGTTSAPTICYATDSATDALFKNIQALANRYADRVGFSPIFVDGKIGPGTVEALKKIATSLLSDPMTAAVGVGLTPQVVSKETIARGAKSIAQLLQNGVNIAQLPPKAAPTVPSSTPATTSTSLPVPPPPAPHRKIWPFVLGGAAVLGAGYFLMRKPKKGRKGGRAQAAA